MEATWTKQDRHNAQYVIIYDLEVNQTENRTGKAQVNDDSANDFNTQEAQLLQR